MQQFPAKLRMALPSMTPKTCTKQMTSFFTSLLGSRLILRLVSVENNIFLLFVLRLSFTVLQANFSFKSICKCLSLYATKLKRHTMNHADHLVEKIFALFCPVEFPSIRSTQVLSLLKAFLPVFIQDVFDGCSPIIRFL